MGMVRQLVSLRKRIQMKNNTEKKEKKRKRRKRKRTIGGCLCVAARCAPTTSAPSPHSLPFFHTQRCKELSGAYCRSSHKTEGTEPLLISWLAGKRRREARLPEPPLDKSKSFPANLSLAKACPVFPPAINHRLQLSFVASIANPCCRKRYLGHLKRLGVSRSSSPKRKGPICGTFA